MISPDVDAPPYQLGIVHLSTLNNEHSLKRGFENCHYCHNFQIVTFFPKQGEKRQFSMWIMFGDDEDGNDDDDVIIDEVDNDSDLCDKLGDDG